eukprot:6801404-Pyramimonas_sp.AAC.1
MFLGCEVLVAVAALKLEGGSSSGCEFAIDALEIAAVREVRVGCGWLICEAWECMGRGGAPGSATEAVAKHRLPLS